MHEKETPVPSHAGNEIQSCVGMLNLSLYKKSIGSFWFKVMNSTIYSIQREVNKEFESLVVSYLAFALWFHKN